MSATENDELVERADGDGLTLREIAGNRIGVYARS